MKRTVEYIALVAAVLAAIWFYVQPGFEPAIAFLAGMVTFFGVHLQNKSGSHSSLLLRALWPLRRQLSKRKAIAEFSFSTLDGKEALRHKIKALHVWDKHGPTGTVQLYHKSNRLSPYVFDLVEGHSFEFGAEDFNGDGTPELITTFHAGAHTKVLKIYSVNHGGMLSLIPGGEIGSDWPEITWADRDKDGKKEIYVKQRNWKGEPAAESLEERYVLLDGAYVLEQ